MNRADHPSTCKIVCADIFYKLALPVRVLIILNLHECINFKVNSANKSWRFILLYRCPSQTQNEFQIIRSRAKS